MYAYVVGAGRNIGGALLDWAARVAASRGCRWLRLDAWRTNEALHRYYERQGFSPIRVVELAHRGSGALFQRPTGINHRSALSPPVPSS
ncbi:GNAT family N-acetyltransferase [Micromonospora sp. NPDC047738]|uniref:GNAT family N-acetyltransferase n=1 Tax=Micromonospora sp. NPDC047738 TaxID=3155741 RepID=UPI0033E0E7AF